MYRGERFNGYTHLAGAILAAAGTYLLVEAAALRSDPWRLASFSVYGATLFLLFLVSTLYHSTRGRAKDVLRKLDHSAIYVVIAGTYTPFALVSLDGNEWGWRLFAAVWSLAAVGIAQEFHVARGRRFTSLAIYLLMGWLGLLLVSPLLDALTERGFGLLLGGGVIYTVGVVFYLFDSRFTHWHGIWHLFVLAGSAVHYLTILHFVA